MSDQYSGILNEKEIQLCCLLKANFSTKANMQINGVCQLFDTPYFRYFVTFYPNPTTHTILHAWLNICAIEILIPPTKVLHFSDMCKQIYHNSIHCISKDIQLCYLFKANFSTKAINMLTRQSLQTIYQRKTQIRQKLSIPEKTAELDDLSNSAY